MLTGSVSSGRVSPDNLVCYEQNRRYRYIGQQIVECCAYIRTPTPLGLLIDVSRRNILAAKRLGLTVISIQGNPMHAPESHRIRGMSDIFLL
jgi:hypothetical protein